MTRDVLTQLTAYGEYCDDRQGSVTVSEILRTEAPELSGSTVVSVDTASQSGAYESREQRNEDLTVDYLQLRSDENSVTARYKSWRGVAVAVAATILVVVGVLVAADGNGGDIVTDQASTPSTADPIASPAVTAQQFVPASDRVFPLEGAVPSTPETGELVAGVAFSRFIDFPDADRWRDTAIMLYADGRLLRYPTPDVHGGIAEQRLTPEGVELVRSAFFSTGLDAGQTPELWSACQCVIKARDESGRLVFSGDAPPAPSPQVDPQIQGEVDRLTEFITHLDASLPTTAWADREIKAYVPSRYEISVWFEPWEAPESLRDGLYNRAVPDLSNVLAQVLPRAVVRHLDDQGWQHTYWGDSVVLTTADARALAQAFTDAGHTPGDIFSGMGLTYHPTAQMPDPTSFHLRVEALLPDGQPLWAPG